MTQDSLINLVERADHQLSILQQWFDEAPGEQAAHRHTLETLSTTLGELRTEASGLDQKAGGSSELLQVLFDTIPIGIIVCDGSGKILQRNAHAEILLGSTLPGVPHNRESGYTVHLPNGADFPPNQMPLRRAIEQQEVTHDVEMLVHLESGVEKLMLTAGAPMRDSLGKVFGAVMILQDITERRQMQREIHRYADRLQVLRALDQAILATQSTREIAYSVLDHLKKLLPYRWASVATFDLQANNASVLATSSTGEGRSIPIKGTWPLEVLKQGKIHVMEMASSPLSMLQDLQGSAGSVCVSVPLMVRERLTGVLNLGLDSTDEMAFEEIDVAYEVADVLAIGFQQAHLYRQLERHADELENLVTIRTAKLRASEARFREIFERAAIGIVLLDRERRILDSNPALREILGYHDDSLHGLSLADIIQPDEPVDERAHFQGLIAGKQSRYTLETRFIRRDGEIGWANLLVSLVPEGVDRPALAMGMFQDITEQKEAQEALLRAEKLALVGKLAASLAHEINNPLQSVIGYLGLAEEILQEGGDVQRHIGIALEELRRAANNVAKLRDLSRPSIREDRQPTDLNVLVEKVLLLNQKRFQNWGVEVDWMPDRDLPLVPVVPELVQQVFLNLVLNATEAMPDGGRVRVRTGRQEQPPGVTIEFIDSGIGISDDNLSRVFDAFHSTKPEGLGLGLYVSQTIVEDHGGHIKVQSQADKGTRFTVWLPWEKPVG